MSTTTLSSEHIIKLLFTADALPTRPTEWFAALLTARPGPSGDDYEVQVGTDANYARQSVGLTAAEAAGYWSATNGAEVAFPASAAATKYTVSHLAIFDAETGGNAIAVLPLEPARDVNPGGQLRFPVGEIIIEGFVNDN